MKKVYCIESTNIGGKDATFSIQRDLPLVERWMSQLRDVKLFIIDPLNSYLGQQINPYLNTQVRSVLEPVRRWAEKHNISVLANGHTRKGANEKASDALSGSSALFEVPRSSFLVCPDGDKDRRKLFLPVENNLGVKARGLGYYIVSWKKDKNIPRIRWSRDPVYKTADEAISVARARGGTPDALKQCTRLIYELLRDGAKLHISDVKEAAAQRGLNWRTMQEAARELRKSGKLQSKRSGFGNKDTWWRLNPKSGF